MGKILLPLLALFFFTGCSDKTELFMQQEFWPNVLPIFAVLLSTLGSWLLVVLRRKLHLEHDVMTEVRIRSVIRRAIAGVEEYAAHKLKSEKMKLGGVEKAKMVYDVVKTLYPELTSEDVDRIIREEIALIPGMGATGNTLTGEPPKEPTKELSDKPSEGTPEDTPEDSEKM